MKVAPRLIVVLAVSCLAGGVFAQDLKKEVEGVYAKFMRLAIAKDVKGVAKMLDPDFVMVDSDGKVMNYEQNMAMMKEMIQICRNVKYKLVVDEVHQNGDEVVAWVSMKMDMQMKQGDKWVPMSFNDKVVETLKKTASGWVFTHSCSLGGQ